MVAGERMTIAHAWIQERILAAQAGDMAAFGDVVEHLHGVIRGYLAMHGAPASEEEELAQRAFVEAFQKLPDFDPGRPFLPWLRGIARYVLLRWFERREIEGRHQHDRVRRFLADRADTTGEEAEADARFDAEHLQACLERLKPAAVGLIRDRYYADLDAPAIADRDGCSTESIRMALSRARAALRRCIEARLGLAERPLEGEA
jgi:RNA polymerase sigma-70 factor (ECF subfamily)